MEELGLFYNAIQSELIKKNIDAAVHSLKDIPVEYSEQLILAAIPERLDAKDVLFHPEGLSINDLPPGSVVGTCSLRRKGQILNLRNDVVIQDIRGNIQTRIDKVHSGEYDAIILAAAGLIRLDHDISKYYIFDFDEITPAPGQGALAVETRRDAKELINMMSRIDNMSIRKAVEVERSILKHIGAGCSVPIGVFASSTDNVFDIVACYVNPDSGEKIIIKRQKMKDQADKITKVILDELLSAMENNIDDYKV
jgi:hydroxymethylbilane synthase